MTYYELNSLYGHATFLLDLNGVGAGVKVGPNIYLSDRIFYKNICCQLAVKQALYFHVVRNGTA